MFTASMKLSLPAGSLAKRLSTQMWPSAALKVKLNTVAPMRINMTKQERTVVFSSACLNSLKSSFLREKAMIMAPVAPRAPPSVGVATPMKMVPRTRKISTSGGSRTKTTRSDSLDSRCRCKRLLSVATRKATNEATVTERVITSSEGDAPVRSRSGFIRAS